MSGRTTKRCPSSFHIGERLIPTTDFGYSSKDDLQSWCKACKKASYRADAERILAEHATRYREDEEFRELKKSITRQWARENPERDRENSRRWAVEHRDRVNERSRQFYDRHRERIREYRRQWRDDNREQYRAAQRRWTEANRDYSRASSALRKAQEKANGGNLTKAKFRARWDYFNGKCWMCGDPAEQMDHVKPVAKGGGSWASNLRPACIPCNQKKKAKWPFPTTLQ